MAESEVRQGLKEKISSKRGQNFITFLIFVAIASGLWIVMSLNDTTQREYPIHVAVADLPEGITYCHDDNTPIDSNGDLGIYTVIVKERGLFHKSFAKKNPLPLVINFTDFNSSKDGVFYLTSAKMETALQEYLGDNAIIVTWKPSVVSFKISD